jgi:two-component system, cell cycle sensor histidine kinase PleC
MKGQSTNNFRRRSARMLKRRIVAFSAAIMAAIAGLVTEAVLKERSAALEQAWGEAANLSAGLEEQVRGTLNGVAGATAFLKSRIEADGPDGFDLHEWRARVPELVSPAIQILIVDKNGKVSASTRDYGPGPLYLSDRDYYLAHRANPGLGFFVGQPVFGKISMRLTIPATRRLNSPSGEFAGALSFSLDPALLTTLHQKVHLGRTASLDIVRSDGIIMARYTQAKGLDQASIGMEAVDFQAGKQGSQARAGAFSGESTIDRVSRLYHWRKVAGYPLYVMAGLGESEIMASANYQARIIIGLGVAALCLPLIMMFMLNREISQRVEHAVALDDESEKVRQEHAALLSMTEELAGERIKLRKANTELVLARQRAEEANRAKSVFLAHMSHELRTPLNAILGFSEIIRDKVFGKDPDRYADYAADIHRSGSHLLNIVSDILDITRIEAGRLELREEQVKLEHVLQECLLAVAPQAAAGQVFLARKLPPIGAFIHGDTTKLTQIFINLLSNAIKFTPPNGSVGIAFMKEKDGCLTLTVNDTGIGMSGSEIKDALETFRQVDSSLGRRFQGTGLGLPLAVQLTELHGGILIVESAPGKGTSVHVHFPAERVRWQEQVPACASRELISYKIAS